MRGRKTDFALSLKQRVPQGEYMEEFLKERSLWSEFQKSVPKSRYGDEILALEMFIREKNLWEDFRMFRSVRVVGIRLSGRAEGMVK